MELLTLSICESSKAAAAARSLADLACRIYAKLISIFAVRYEPCKADLRLHRTGLPIRVRAEIQHRS